MSPRLLRRKNAAIQFNVMVCGFEGVGKTSFIRTFCQALNLSSDNSGASREQIVPQANEMDPNYISMEMGSDNGDEEKRGRDGEEHSEKMDKIGGLSEIIRGMMVEDYPEPTKTFQVNEFDVNEEGERIHLRFIDTPGLVNDYRLDHQILELVRYVESQFDTTLAEETKIRRNPKAFDAQVHVCLFLINPQNRGISESEARAINKLGKRVNILPVVAKADTLTIAQSNLIKSCIREQVYELPVFRFETNASDEEDIATDEWADPELEEENRELLQLYPFSIISAESATNMGRRYAWGFVNCLDPSHCDFTVVRAVLLVSHRQLLRDMTYRVYYERYRTEKLLARKASLEMSEEQKQRLLENLNSL
ncbi:uncharacterized protein VTP21DRAFT_2349 [Calcarisporiella thermophila]|uniref:uncharacterized protein n=1 Tax=Calcarisporiella thermophila TaxID=911321 RepID=UPI0037444EEC